MPRPPRARPCPSGSTAISLEFWMVRSSGGNYCLYRTSKKPHWSKKVSKYNPSNSWWAWSGTATQWLCARQIHALFPGLGRMKTGDSPKRIRLTMESV